MRFGGVPHTLAADDDGDAWKKRAWSTGKCTFGTRNRIFSSQLVILKYTPDQTINMCVTGRKKPCPWLVWWGRRGNRVTDTLRAHNFFPVSDLGSKVQKFFDHVYNKTFCVLLHQGF
jgi:hypothetical protein